VEGVRVALLVGELVARPTMEGMDLLLHSAEMTVTVGQYSIRVEEPTHFVFQQDGGDLGDPVIDADAESVAELLATAPLVSDALTLAGVVHRFELYDDSENWLITCTTGGRCRR
jgi:hypothetical protein